MQRTIIQSTLMLLAVLAISVSINAQSSQQYSADIPFDFEARGKQHAAGKYRLSPASVNSPGAIVLREMKSGKGRVLGITRDSGTNNWDQQGTLTFVKVNGRYRLSEVSTATFKLRMKDVKTEIPDEGNIAYADAVKIKLH